MAVSIAEYLGQRTDVANPIIPSKSSEAICPFMHHSCTKLERGNKPICSVRKSDEEKSLWIVCEHRLCATKKTIKRDGKIQTIPLSDHQSDILLQVAKTIFSPTIKANEILVKREVPLRVDEIE
jgi:hypothetical protein